MRLLVDRGPSGETAELVTLLLAHQADANLQDHEVACHMALHYTTYIN